MAVGVEIGHKLRTTFFDSESLCGVFDIGFSDTEGGDGVGGETVGGVIDEIGFETGDVDAVLGDVGFDAGFP